MLHTRLDREPENIQEEDQESSSKTRWILLGTFGGMLLLMVLAGLDSLRSLERLNQVSNETTRQFSKRSRALVTVVVSFHAYTDRMEQYLLSDEVTSDPSGAAEITKRGSAVHAAIGDYPNGSQPEERALLEQLENGVSSQESSFSGVLGSKDSERKHQEQVMVSDRLIPGRAQVLQLAAALAALNEKHFSEQDRALALQFESLQTRLGRTVLLALAAGLLLSVVAGYYILRLEHRGRERYLALARSRQELESLSRRLVNAQEAERRSISRELHDEVGQTLGVLLMDIGHLSSLLASSGKPVAEQIGRIKTAAEMAVKSIRDIALLLRPPMLDDLGLLPALEWQARETSRRSEMEVDVRAEEPATDPPNEVKVCIYRVVQEALRNAATHARAKTASVVLKKKERRIVAEISDDGTGFDPERIRGVGILGMEERVRQLGGSFEIRSAPGKGTTVRAELPLAGATAG